MNVWVSTDPLGTAVTIEVLDKGTLVSKAVFDLGAEQPEQFLGDLACLVAAATSLERRVKGEFHVKLPCTEALVDFLNDSAVLPYRKEYRIIAEKTQPTVKRTTRSHHDPVIVTFSGGVGSTACLVRLREQGINCIPVSFDTGQTAFSGGVWSESDAAKLIADTLGVKRHVARCKFTKKPEGETQWLKALRNPMMVMVASTYGCGRLVTQSGQRGDRIADNDPVFTEPFSVASGIDLVMPNEMLFTCDEVAYLDREVQWQPYRSTYSCQMGKRVGRDYFCCGVCHSCIQRAMGMTLNWIDPVADGVEPLRLSCDRKPHHYYKADWLRSRQLYEFIMNPKYPYQRLPFQAMVMRVLKLSNLRNVGHLASLVAKRDKAEAEQYMLSFWRGEYQVFTLNDDNTVTYERRCKPHVGR